MNGSIVCDEIKCPKLECERGELSYEDDLCCPVCRGMNLYTGRRLLALLKITHGPRL